MCRFWDCGDSMFHTLIKWLIKKIKASYVKLEERLGHGCFNPPNHNKGFQWEVYNSNQESHLGFLIRKMSTIKMWVSCLIEHKD